MKKHADNWEDIVTGSRMTEIEIDGEISSLFKADWNIVKSKTIHEVKITGQDSAPFLEAIESFRKYYEEQLQRNDDIYKERLNMHKKEIKRLQVKLNESETELQKYLFGNTEKSNGK